MLKYQFVSKVVLDGRTSHLPVNARGNKVLICLLIKCWWIKEINIYQTECCLGFSLGVGLTDRLPWLCDDALVTCGLPFLRTWTISSSDI